MNTPNQATIGNDILQHAQCRGMRRASLVQRLRSRIEGTPLGLFLGGVPPAKWVCAGADRAGNIYILTTINMTSIPAVKEMNRRTE